MLHTAFHVQQPQAFADDKKTKMEVQVRSIEGNQINLSALENEVVFQLREAYFANKYDSNSFSFNQIKRTIYGFLKISDYSKAQLVFSQIILQQLGGDLKNVTQKLAFLHSVCPQNNIILHALQHSIEQLSKNNLRKIQEGWSMTLKDWLFESTQRDYLQPCKFDILLSILNGGIAEKSGFLTQFTQYLTSSTQDLFASADKLEAFCGNLLWMNEFSLDIPFLKIAIDSLAKNTKIVSQATSDQIISRVNEGKNPIGSCFLVSLQFPELFSIFEQTIALSLTGIFRAYLNINDLQKAIDYHSTLVSQLQNHQRLSDQYWLTLRNILNQQPELSFSLTQILDSLIRHKEQKLFERVSTLFVSHISNTQAFEICYRGFLFKRVLYGITPHEIEWGETLVSLLGSNKMHSTNQILIDLRREKDAGVFKSAIVSVALLSKISFQNMPTFQNETFTQTESQILQKQGISNIYQEIIAQLKLKHPKKSFFISKQIKLEIQIEFQNIKLNGSMSLQQYMILLCFINRNQISFAELKNLLQIEEQELKAVLSSLNQTSTNEKDNQIDQNQSLLIFDKQVKAMVIQYNTQYKHDGFDYFQSFMETHLILITQTNSSGQQEGQQQITKSTQIERDSDRFAETKKYLIEAGMVKMAKSLKKFDKNSLFQSALEYLKDKIILDFSSFDSALSSLIKKQYIQESENGQLEYIP